MKPPHEQSPEICRSVSQYENLRQRQQRNAEEIVRFVRELQVEKQPSSLCLQKKSPLPSIGYHSSMGGNKNYSGFHEKTIDSTDSDDDSFDDEILHAQTRRKTKPVDPLFIEMLTCPRESMNTSNDYSVLSRSLSTVPKDVSNNNIYGTSRRNSNRTGKKNSKLSRCSLNNRHYPGKQLPPLQQDSVQDRPSAPSPSRTSPMSEYSIIDQDSSIEYLS